MHIRNSWFYIGVKLYTFYLLTQTFLKGANIFLYINISNLTEKVQKAKEAVEDLEEPLKTEAFKKILDKLLQEENDFTTNLKIPPKKFSQKNKIKTNQSNLKLKEESEKRKKDSADKINRTNHPKIHEFNNTLTRALYVLKIMKEKNVDGLTPPEIAFILKEVFRIKARNEAVSVALKDAHKYVDRRKIIIGHASAYVYRLMKNGEDYLENNLIETKEGENET